MRNVFFLKEQTFSILVVSNGKASVIYPNIGEGGISELHHDTILTSNVSYVWKSIVIYAEKK